MEDPVYVLKGSLAAATVTAIGLVLYDTFLPSTEQRIRKLKIKHKLDTIAMDVDPNIIRAFISLKTYEEENAEAWKTALGRMDSVCMIYKLLLLDPSRQPTEDDYSVAYIHFEHGMKALASLYDNVRSKEMNLYEQRENARAQLDSEKKQRAKQRQLLEVGGANNYRRRSLQNAETLQKNQKLASIKLRCDEVKDLVAIINELIQNKIHYIKDRIQESLLSEETEVSQLYSEEEEEEEEEEQEEDD